jgi:hypothetical protein
MYAHRLTQAARSHEPPSRVGPGARSAAGDAPSVHARCWKCGSAYDPGSWVALPMIELILAPEVQRVLLDWPANVAVEVRECASCGTQLARKQATG